MTHSSFETKHLNVLVEPLILIDANLVRKTEDISFNSLENKIPYLGEPRWTTLGWPASKFEKNIKIEI